MLCIVRPGAVRSVSAPDNLVKCRQWPMVAVFCTGVKVLVAGPRKASRNAVKLPESMDTIPGKPGTGAGKSGVLSASRKSC